MTYNSLTENEEQNIPSHFEDHFWIARLRYFLYVCFPIHLKGPVIPDPSGQLAELIVYITSTRVDLYSHQILFGGSSSTSDELSCTQAQMADTLTHADTQRQARQYPNTVPKLTSGKNFTQILVFKVPLINMTTCIYLGIFY